MWTFEHDHFVKLHARLINATHSRHKKNAKHGLYVRFLTVALTRGHSGVGLEPVINAGLLVPHQGFQVVSHRVNFVPPLHVAHHPIKVAVRWNKPTGAFNLAQQSDPLLILIRTLVKRAVRDHRFPHEFVIPEIGLEPTERPLNVALIFRYDVVAYWVANKLFLRLVSRFRSRPYGGVCFPR